MCAIELYRPNYGGSQLVLIERLEFPNAQQRAQAINKSCRKWKRKWSVTHWQLTRVDPPDRFTLNHPTGRSQYAAEM